MKQWIHFGTGLVFVGLLAVGCSSNKSKDNDDGGGPDGRYLLQEEPAGALSVKEAKARVKDDDEVTIVGRIGGGGGDNPWYGGLAGFHVVDMSFKPCPDDEGCPTPWDYCCVDPDERRNGTASIKVVDAEGNPLRTEARRLLGVRELQTVVARGKAKRDEGGNLIVHVSGVYVRPDKKK